MELSKRVRIVELRTAIEFLEGNKFPSPEESDLLTLKRQELTTLNPQSPPFPEGGDVDLRCSRQEVEEDVERLTIKAKDRLAQIERETVPARKALLEHDPLVVRLRAAEHRLARFNQLAVWMAFKSEQEAKRGQ
jgi:hypothetical protein